MLPLIEFSSNSLVIRPEQEAVWSKYASVLRLQGLRVGSQEVYLIEELVNRPLRSVQGSSHLQLSGLLVCELFASNR